MRWVRATNMKLSNIYLSHGRWSPVREEMKTSTHSLLKPIFQFIWYPCFVRRWDISNPNSVHGIGLGYEFCKDYNNVDIQYLLVSWQRVSNLRRNENLYSLTIKTYFPFHLKPMSCETLGLKISICRKSDMILYRLRVWKFILYCLMTKVALLAPLYFFGGKIHFGSHFYTHQQPVTRIFFSVLFGSSILWFCCFLFSSVFCLFLSVPFYFSSKRQVFSVKL